MEMNTVTNNGKHPSNGTLGCEGDSEPCYRLYSPSGVALATFFASPLAGGLLMLINHKRLGNLKSSGETALLTLAVFLLTLFLAFMLPVHIPGIVISLPGIFIMRYVAIKKFSSTISEHLVRQGKMESNWKALGISLLVVLAAACVFFLWWIISEGVNY